MVYFDLQKEGKRLFVDFVIMSGYQSIRFSAYDYIGGNSTFLSNPPEPNLQ